LVARGPGATKERADARRIGLGEPPERVHGVALALGQEHALEVAASREPASESAVDVALHLCSTVAPEIGALEQRPEALIVEPAQHARRLGVARRPLLESPDVTLELVELAKQRRRRLDGIV